VSASAVVRNQPSQHNPGGGFGRGFDLFLEDCVWKAASCVNRQAFQHLPRREPGEGSVNGNGDAGKPLFLYLHYIDPHGPYSPPSTYRRQFATAPPERPFIRNGNANPIGNWLYKKAPDPRVSPRELQHLVDLYDDEIAFWDSEFARLLERLREAGLLEDSILVVAADHGEEFLEHGDIKHCRNLFDTSVRTPLILRIPGVEPKQVAAAVENVDIVPTLLDYLGIETVGLTLDGHSLRPLIEGEESEGEESEPKGGEKPREHRQYASQGPWRGVSDGRYKLIHDLAKGGFALYDLSADPGEKRDVLRDQRRTFHRLREDLTAWLGRAEGQWAASESLRKAEEAEKKLRSLGYLE
jgi:arylsulfatase